LENESVLEQKGEKKEFTYNIWGKGRELKTNREMQAAGKKLRAK